MDGCCGPTTKAVLLTSVQVVSNGLTLICEYEGGRFALPFGVMLPGTTVLSPGDVGMVVVPDWFAELHGLRHDEPSPGAERRRQ